MEVFGGGEVVRRGWKLLLVGGCRRWGVLMGRRMEYVRCCRTGRGRNGLWQIGVSRRGVAVVLVLDEKASIVAHPPLPRTVVYYLHYQGAALDIEGEFGIDVPDFD